MKKNNIVLIIIAIVTLLTFIIGATYAYFATGNLNITNVVNANTITEQNNMVFDTLGGAMLLNVTASNIIDVNQVVKSAISQLPLILIKYNVNSV